MKWFPVIFSIEYPWEKLNCLLADWSGGKGCCCCCCCMKRRPPQFPFSVRFRLIGKTQHTSARQKENLKKQKTNDFCFLLFFFLFVFHWRFHLCPLSLSLYLFDFYLLNSCFCLFSKLFGSFIKIVNFLNLKKKTKKEKENHFLRLKKKTLIRRMMGH